MAEKFLMPKLSPTMEEGQIARWVKTEGDAYDAGETLAEVDTDKATMEMTALTGGTLLKILKNAGDTAALGEAIAITGNKGEDISVLLTEVETSAPAKPATENTEKEKQTEAVSAPVSKAVSAVPSAAALTVPQSEIRNPQSNGRLIVSPIAARMAAENAIDLKTIRGTGPNGRIIKRDIEIALESQAPSPKPQVQREFIPSTVVGASAYTDETTSQIRRVIASRLAESIGPIPTFY
ncbi:MAG: biotin/lipoyl-containing protein, partial [Pyrinomonadaceae bacterium]